MVPEGERRLRNAQTNAGQRGMFQPVSVESTYVILLILGERFTWPEEVSLPEASIITIDITKFIDTIFLAASFIENSSQRSLTLG